MSSFPLCPVGSVGSCPPLERGRLYCLSSFCYFWIFSRNDILMVAFAIYQKFWESTPVLIVCSITVNLEIFTTSTGFFEHCDPWDRTSFYIFAFDVKTVSIIMATLSFLRLPEPPTIFMSSANDIYFVQNHDSLLIWWKNPYLGSTRPKYVITSDA